MSVQTWSCTHYGTVVIRSNHQSCVLIEFNLKSCPSHQSSQEWSLKHVLLDIVFCVFTGILRYQIDFQVLSGQVFDELDDDFDLDDYWIGITHRPGTKSHDRLDLYSDSAFWDIRGRSVNAILLVYLGCHWLTLPFADVK